MLAFWNFIIKESRHIFRDRRTMLILFGMPIVMMLLLGFAIRTDVRNVRTLVVLSSADHATQRLVAQLDASDYFSVVGTVASPTEAERRIRAQEADLALVFPARFAAAARTVPTVQLLTDATDPNMAQQYVQYARSVLMQMRIGTAYGLDGTSLIATRQLYNPQMRSAYNFVPGIMGLLLMLICAMMTSISIVREKERGTMEVLLVSPVRPLSIILAKAVPYFVLALFILAVVLWMSWAVLDVPLAGSMLWIVGISLVYILMALSLGLLISNVAHSQLVALLLSALVLLMPCLLLSGMMFPVESMPLALQVVAHIVPTTYYIAAMRKLMVMGVAPEHVLFEGVILAGYTLTLLSIALFTFKRRLE